MECGKISRIRKITGANRRRGKALKTNWRNEAKIRDGFKCRICRFAEIVHAHHIHPKRLGGKDELENLITLCPNHHAMVHAKMITPEELTKVINKPVAVQSELKLTRIMNFRS